MVKYGLLVGLATALLVIPVGARADSIDGTWKTIDDETKQAKALVLITTDVNGETSGKVYSARAKLIEDGKRLDVRGYVGFSLLGRSQVWERQ